MAGDEIKQFAVAGGCCCELLISDGFAVFGDNGDLVGVGVGINATMTWGSSWVNMATALLFLVLVCCTLARPADSTVMGLKRFRLLY